MCHGHDNFKFRIFLIFKYCENKRFILLCFYDFQHKNVFGDATIKAIVAESYKQVMTSCNRVNFQLRITIKLKLSFTFFYFSHYVGKLTKLIGLFSTTT